ncbi:MAG TPA: PLP-dependent lyase/thiolase [Solirubrobacterales bacterium]
MSVTRHVPETSGEADRPLADLIASHDGVVQLISERLLTSLECMRELVELIKDDVLRSTYGERAVPVLVELPSDGLDISDATGQLRIVDVWVDDATKLDEGLSTRGHVGEPLDELREDLAATREVAAHIMRFMRTISNHVHTTFYTRKSDAQLRQIVASLRAVELAAGSVAGNGAPSAVGFTSTDRETLERLHDGIVVVSEDDPDEPEFPPFSPRFPATPTVRIKVPQLGRSILVKDESHNLTGSHKDRMAWEIVVHYKTLLKDLLEPSVSESKIPPASIISNGSAAFAIQIMMRCYGLPDLRVLVDRHTDRRITDKLRRIGCHVVVHDLSERELDTTDVLELTENPGGIDFTARDVADPNRRTYYDWLAYEIFNHGARHIFVPVGTGDLFVNVLTVLSDELKGMTNDRRLHNDVATIEGVEFYGATSDYYRTKMDKLWAEYRPTLEEARRVCSDIVDGGLCGPRSRIYGVDERYVQEALDTAHAGGIRCDASGIAGLALLLQLSSEEGEIPADEEILIVNTGLLALP